MVLIGAGRAPEPGPRRTICRRDVVAARAGLTGVLRRHRHQQTAVPADFVVQLSPELEPPLVENGFIQSRLSSYFLTRLLNRASGRLRQVPNLQILNTHQRVCLTDGRRSFVQVVAAGIADPGMGGLYTPFGLEPVLAELLLAAHG